MAAFTLSTLLAVAAVVKADYFSTDPLVDKAIAFDAIPYQVMSDTDDPRGFQTGYNQCNSTTENQDSLCQTMFVNHIDDFCLWAPPTPNTTISDSEGVEVAWCTKAGHGGRLIPAGAITGLQYVQTPSYIQVAGFINQAMLNIGGTYGGELDSGGQDGEGNPMGGLVYVNSFPSNDGNNASYQQAQHWSFFIGGNSFCGKVCDQTGSNAHGLCNNIYDRLGCDYNAPNNAVDGVFESCQGADMSPVGTYTANGVTSVYTQPASEDDPLGVIPYTATPAPTSNCVTYTSSLLYTDLAAVTAAAGNPVSGSAATATATGSAGASGSGLSTAKASGSGSGTGSGTASAAKATGSSSGAAALGVSMFTVGIAIAVVAVFA